MDIYRNASSEEQYSQQKHVALDIVLAVDTRMMRDVISEVLDEVKQEEEEEWDMFDDAFLVDEEFNILPIADDMHEEETAPRRVPSSQWLTTPPTPPELQGIEENIQDDEETEEEEHRKYVMDRRNINTVKKTASVSPFLSNWGGKKPDREVLRKVQGYFRDEIGEKRDILDILPKKLASLMSTFILGVKKTLPKGVTMETATDEQKYHQPDTLTSYYTGVARYCRKNGYPVCLITDSHFTLFKKVLETRRGELKEMGLGNRPNEAIPLSDEDTEADWESGAFGDSTPRILQNTIYFYFSNAFGWRGRDEQADARWGDIAVIDEGGPNEHLKWNERSSKTRKGKGKPRMFRPNLWAIEGSDRCPVALYKILRSKRSEEQRETMKHLFLTPKFHATWEMEVPYKNSNMLEGSIGKIMTAVKFAAGLCGPIKGHSVRKTCCTNLLQAGVPPNIICQLTGHANVNSLNNYACTSVAQQKEMSDILVGGKRPRYNELAPGSSLLKHSRPAAAAGCAADLEEDTTMDEAPMVEPPAPVRAVQRQAPVEVQAPVVLAPGPGQGALQARMGGMPVEVAGMFAGATINGPVNVHIHYGNVAATARMNTQVNMSPTCSPTIPHALP